MKSFLRNVDNRLDRSKNAKNEWLATPKSSSAAFLRLRKDMEELSFRSFSARGTVVKIQKPHGDGKQTFFTCTVTPAEGLFAHGTFVFMFQVPHTYPFSPPMVKCLNRVFHQNFDFRTGVVYLPILADSWRPVLTMNTVIFSLQLLFLEPVSPTSKKGCRNSILNQEAHRLRQQNPKRYEQLVQETMRGGFFFGEHWATTLRNGPDGTDPPTISVRKRRCPNSERSRKKRRFGENITLSDLRYLSLNEDDTKTEDTPQSFTEKLNSNRKRALGGGYNGRSNQKRRKRPSFVLDDAPPTIHLPNPEIFLNYKEEDDKHTYMRQSVMMEEDL